jgi:hypothetical protein
MDIVNYFNEEMARLGIDVRLSSAFSALLKGKSVIVLHRKEHFAEEMSSKDRYYLRERLERGGVTLTKNVHGRSFLTDGVRNQPAIIFGRCKFFYSIRPITKGLNR